MYFSDKRALRAISYLFIWRCRFRTRACGWVKHTHLPFMICIGLMSNQEIFDICLQLINPLILCAITLLPYMIISITVRKGSDCRIPIAI